MASKLLILNAILFLLSREVFGAQNGIIGFGLSLYQDSCCLACHDSLSSLYLGCTTFPNHHNMSSMDMSMKMDMDMDMDMMGTTSEDCRASDTPWLQTMAYCIQQSCGIHGYTVEQQSICFSVHAVAGASKPTFRDCLPGTAPTAELPQDAMWLNATSLVNPHLYHATHGTLEEFARSEYIHTRYSVILYLLVIGTCLIWGIKNHLAILFPTIYRRARNKKLSSHLQQRLTLPALFGQRHLEPLPANLGYIPSRPLSISISIYIALNILFSSISFASFQPNIYWPSQRSELCEYVGNRTGILSLVNMSIAILFAGRNNLLIAVTGWSQTTFLTLHRWAARVATLQAIVHSGVYTLQYVDPGYEGATSYSAKVAEPFYWWGIIGTIALSLAATFAALPLRIALYEVFLALHIVLIILALVACWYHLVPHFGFKYGYQVWLYICFAFWSADRLARLARILYYNRPGNAKAIVEAISDCNILQITVFPRTTHGIGPGQHTFLHIPALGKFWESHPFSIAAWDTHQTSRLPASNSISTSKGNNVYPETKELGSTSPGTDSSHQVKSATVSQLQEKVPYKSHKNDEASFRLLVRAHSGMTATLLKHLSSPTRSSKAEISVYTEGHYAGHHATFRPLFTADTVLCLAGGLGITHVLGFVQEYARKAALLESDRGESARVGKPVLMGGTKRFVLAWSAKEAFFIEHVRTNFLADARGVECWFWYTGPAGTRTRKTDVAHDEGISGCVPTGIDAGAVTVGRMDVASVIRSTVEVGRQTAVLVCGPGQMADEARRELVECVKDGFCVDLLEEAFAW